jgi:short-subunit dehydrogenase
MAGPERRPVALVTGASGGIGAELARVLAANGHDLVLVARTTDRLAAVARELSAAHGIEARTLAADLALGDAPEVVARSLASEGGEVDVLVNNAGFGLHGPFATTDGARELEMIALNVCALTRLTKALLPGMIARRRGRILNLASTAGFVPGPYMAVYYATKAYVVSFSQAIAEELRGTGVTVTALCPGATRTGFAGTAGMEGSRLFRRGVVMDAATVARAGYDGMMAGRAIVVPGLANKAIVASTRVSPRGLLARVTARLQDHGTERTRPR